MKETLFYFQKAKKPTRICEKLKIKISVYIVTSVFSFILNIFPTNLKHENENKQMDINTFVLQRIKSGSVFLCFDIIYSLILAADIVILCLSLFYIAVF